METKNIPAYITRNVRNYLSDKELIHDEEQMTVQLISGIPQGSILSPLLWNIMYEGLLTTEMPDGITVAGFADDVAIVGRAMNTKKLEESVNKAIQIAHEWMNDRKLKLALHKTETFMLTRKRDYHKSTFTIRVDKERRKMGQQKIR